MEWYCIAGGQQYGPLPLEVLRDWARSGRLRPTDQVWTAGMAAWCPAGGVEGLFGSEGAAGAPPPPVAQLKPHRGAAVLTLGILGITPCFICGIVAWVMANRDLREMQAGIMDRSGRDMTTAGRICGIVGTVLGCIWALATVAYLGMMLTALDVFGR